MCVVDNTHKFNSFERQYVETESVHKKIKFLWEMNAYAQNQEQFIKIFRYAELHSVETLQEEMVNRLCMLKTELCQEAQEIIGCVK